MSALRDRERVQGLVILPGSVEHAEALARDLRPADRLECEAYASEPALAVVRESYRRSLWSWTAFEPGGAPVCAWGVVPLSLLGGRGQPWALTTHRVDRHQRLFARASKAWTAAMLQDFEHLEGWTDGRYGTAERWLSWLGFRLDEPIIAGQVPWIRFWMRRP